MNIKKIQRFIYLIGFLDLLGVSLILPLFLPRVKSFGISHIAAGFTTSIYGGIQLISSPSVDLFASSLIVPLIIIQVRYLGVSHLVAGAISSVYGIVQVATSPLMGRWSDIIGRRPVILICLIATAVSYVILGASQSIPVMILARVIAGIFKHSQTISRALLTDITLKKDRSQAYGRFNAISSMGFIIGPMLGGHLSELENGFYIVCNLGAALFLLDFVLCWMLIPKVSPAKHSSKSLSEGENLTQVFGFIKEIDWAIFGDIFLVRFFLSFSSLVYRSNFSLLIDQNFGAGSKVIGYIISFQSVISSVAGFFTGSISKLYGNSMKELYHSSLLLTISLLGLTIAPSLSLLLICLIPLGISSTVIRVSSSAITIGLCQSTQIGSVTGFGQSIASVARMVTPLVAGITQEISVYGPGLTGSLSAGIGTALAGYITYKNSLNVKDKKE